MFCSASCIKHDLVNRESDTLKSVGAQNSTTSIDTELKERFLSGVIW